MKAAFVLIILLNLLIELEVKLHTNPDKLSIAKGIAIFVSDFFFKLPEQEWKKPPDGIVLDI